MQVAALASQCLDDLLALVSLQRLQPVRIGDLGREVLQFIQQRMHRFPQNAPRLAGVRHVDHLAAKVIRNTENSLARADQQITGLPLNQRFQNQFLSRFRQQHFRCLRFAAHLPVAGFQIGLGKLWQFILRRVEPWLDSFDS